MLRVPRRVPVCVFERSPKGVFRSDRRLIFLGQLNISPALFIGAGGYFAYLSEQSRFRSTVLSELKRIMLFAGLDNTYRVENWFMSKGRLFVNVTKRTHQAKKGFNSASKRLASWRKRAAEALR